ncbi:MAG TPA: hypothetical protein VGR62_23345 [Candidatus Binatia bacterium]|jgi:hypothetical protein|nr:hypothetical protein [Candidatus Binatia bacterium]
MTVAESQTAMRALERRLRKLAAEIEAERERHARQLVAVRRAADRKLTSMLREIATLRHHEARAEVLTRLLAERDAAQPGPSEESNHGQAPGTPGR